MRVKTVEPPRMPDPIRRCRSRPSSRPGRRPRPRAPRPARRAPERGGDNNIAHANRKYRDASGSSGHAIYMAISIDQTNVRLARWTMSSEAVGQRHAEAGQALLVQLGKLEKAGARSEYRTPQVGEAPPDVRGLRL